MFAPSFHLYLCGSVWFCVKTAGVEGMRVEEAEECIEVSISYGTMWMMWSRVDEIWFETWPQQWPILCLGANYLILLYLIFLTGGSIIFNLIGLLWGFEIQYITLLAHSIWNVITVYHILDPQCFPSSSPPTTSLLHSPQPPPPSRKEVSMWAENPPYLLLYP